MARTKARLGALAGTLALAAGMTLTNAGPASAAPTFTFSYQSFSNGDYTINVYNNGVLAGSADWYADPHGVYGPGTGDTVGAWDGLADGYGIAAHLVATTGSPRPPGTPLRTPTTYRVTSPKTPR